MVWARATLIPTRPAISGRPVARIRLQVGDHFTATRSTWGPFPAGTIPACGRLLAFRCPDAATAAVGLAFAAGGDVFFDQSMCLCGFGHVFMVLSAEWRSRLGPLLPGRRLHGHREPRPGFDLVGFDLQGDRAFGRPGLGLERPGSGFALGTHQ